MIEENHDYEKISFRAGIEIHAQLSTQKKLFCHCSANLTREEPSAIVQRKFRPVLGEMGIYDPALLNEFKKGHTIFYEVFDSICTYELDETPPFQINNEALNNCIKLAKMMNCKIVEETNVCRKNYLDGSVPCGFQRTALIGYDGFISLHEDLTTNNGKILQISWIYIEEEAARKDDKQTKEKDIYFKLDRLGIPLVEIVTDHNLNSPKEVVNAARTLGMIIKSSKIGRKGLGAIRQDINVSIAEGARVELKGIQLLQLIPFAIDIEINRQKNLIEIKKELEKRSINAKDVRFNVIEVTDHFLNTKSKIIHSALKRKEKVFLLPILGFKGLLCKKLQSNKTLGSEISDRVKIFTNLKGIIHSDENLKKYGISESEIQKISEYCPKKDSSFIIVIGDEDESSRALHFAYERVLAAFNGVPEETRRVDPNGISTFIRDLHGRSRLYPDTDLLPIRIDSEIVKGIGENLPELFFNRIRRMTEEYKIPTALAEELIYNDKIDIFETLINLGAPKRVVTTTLTQTMTALSREGVDIDNIYDQHLIDIFNNLLKKKFAKEAIPDILKRIGTDPTLSLKIIIQEFDGGMNEEELNQLIKDILDSSKDLILERGMNSFSPLMGLIMKEARGKIDGKYISEKFRKMLSERVSGKESGGNHNE